MNNPLIKIKVSNTDRETLSDMLSCAVSYMVELEMTPYSKDDADYYLRKEEKFKDLRQRIVFEESDND